MSVDRLTPVRILMAKDELEAAMAVGLLAQHGIEAHATGDFTAGFRVEAPGGVAVVVHDKDVFEASRILSETRRPAVVEQSHPTRFRRFTQYFVAGVVVVNLASLLGSDWLNPQKSLGSFLAIFTLSGAVILTIFYFMNRR